MGTDELAGSTDAEITAAVGTVWASLTRPGRWLTSEQRVAVAEECRAATEVRRGTNTCLTDHHRDLVAMIVHDPAALHDTSLATVLGPDTVVDEYVEMSAVAAKIIAIDLLCTGLGLGLLPLPEPGTGEPSRRRPAAAADLGARVPMLSAEDLTEEIGPGIYHVNVRRGHSLVPEEAALQIQLVEALYVPDLLAHGLAGRRGLDRDQIEAIATRVSSLNRVSDSSGIPLDDMAVGLLDRVPQEVGLASLPGATLSSLWPSALEATPAITDHGRGGVMPCERRSTGTRTWPPIVR